MAEPIGVAAGLLGIATFAFQISKEVYTLVDSIRKAPQTIRDLKSELVALDPILGSVRTKATSDASKFEDVRYPLHQCGMVCYDLRSLIQQCTAHSADGTISARDWVRMQYKGRTIDSYKSKLASYKATIGIALNLIALTDTSFTAEAIEEIKATIHNAANQTQPDLEVHLEEITEGLHSLAVEASASSSDRNILSIGDANLQSLERREKALEEDRLALEAEKKAMEQSQQAQIQDSSIWTIIGAPEKIAEVCKKIEPQRELRTENSYRSSSGNGGM